MDLLRRQISRDSFDSNESPTHRQKSRDSPSDVHTPVRRGIVNGHPALSLLVVSIDLPAFNIRTRLEYDIRPARQKKIVEEVVELVRTFEEDLREDLIFVDLEGSQRKLDHLRDSGICSLEGFFKQAKMVEEWKSKVDRASQLMNKMRDAYFKELFHLREQVYQKAKAEKSGADFKATYASHFDPSEYALEDEVAKLVGDKVKIVQQEFATKFDNLETKWGARNRALQEQLKTTKMLQYCKEKLLAKVMKKHGYNDENHVKDELGDVKINVEKVEASIARELEKAEKHALNENKEQLASVDKKPTPEDTSRDMFKRFLVRKFGSMKEATSTIASKRDLGTRIGYIDFADLVNELGYTCDAKLVFKHFSGGAPFASLNEILESISTTATDVPSRRSSVPELGLKRSSLSELDKTGGKAMPSLQGFGDVASLLSKRKSCAPSLGSSLGIIDNIREDEENCFSPDQEAMFEEMDGDRAASDDEGSVPGSASSASSCFSTCSANSKGSTMSKGSKSRVSSSKPRKKAAQKRTGGIPGGKAKPRKTYVVDTATLTDVHLECGLKAAFDGDCAGLAVKKECKDSGTSCQSYIEAFPKVEYTSRWSQSQVDGRMLDKAIDFYDKQAEDNWKSLEALMGNDPCGASEDDEDKPSEVRQKTNDRDSWVRKFKAETSENQGANVRPAPERVQTFAGLTDHIRNASPLEVANCSDSDSASDTETGRIGSLPTPSRVFTHAGVPGCGPGFPSFAVFSPDLRAPSALAESQLMSGTPSPTLSPESSPAHLPQQPATLQLRSLSVLSPPSMMAESPFPRDDAFSPSFTASGTFSPVKHLPSKTSSPVKHLPAPVKHLPAKTSSPVKHLPAPVKHLPAETLARLAEFDQSHGPGKCVPWKLSLPVTDATVQIGPETADFGLQCEMKRIVMMSPLEHWFPADVDVPDAQLDQMLDMTAEIKEKLEELSRRGEKLLDETRYFPARKKRALELIEALDAVKSSGTKAVAAQQPATTTGAAPSSWQRIGEESSRTAAAPSGPKTLEALLSQHCQPASKEHTDQPKTSSWSSLLKQVGSSNASARDRAVSPRETGKPAEELVLGAEAQEEGSRSSKTPPEEGSRSSEAPPEEGSRSFKAPPEEGSRSCNAPPAVDDEFWLAGSRSGRSNARGNVQSPTRPPGKPAFNQQRPSRSRVVSPLGCRSAAASGQGKNAIPECLQLTSGAGLRHSSGLYAITSMTANGQPVWRREKKGAAGRWLYSYNGSWQVAGPNALENDFKTDNCFIASESPHGGTMPQNINSWEMFRAGQWVCDGSISIGFPVANNENERGSFSDGDLGHVQPRPSEDDSERFSVKRNMAMTTKKTDAPVDSMNLIAQRARRLSTQRITQDSPAGHASENTQASSADQLQPSLQPGWSGLLPEAAFSARGATFEPSSPQPLIGDVAVNSFQLGRKLATPTVSLSAVPPLKTPLTASTASTRVSRVSRQCELIPEKKSSLEDTDDEGSLADDFDASDQVFSGDDEASVANSSCSQNYTSKVSRAGATGRSSISEASTTRDVVRRGSSMSLSLGDEVSTLRVAVQAAPKSLAKLKDTVVSQPASGAANRRRINVGGMRTPRPTASSSSTAAPAEDDEERASFSQPGIGRRLSTGQLFFAGGAEPVRHSFGGKTLALQSEATQERSTFDGRTTAPAKATKVRAALVGNTSVRSSVNLKGDVELPKVGAGVF